MSSAGQEADSSNATVSRWAQMKVLAAIKRCPTAMLGGHRDQCVRCGYRTISYNSCRNRHCPKCQTKRA